MWATTNPSSAQFSDAIPAPQSTGDAHGDAWHQTPRQPTPRPTSPARVAGAARSEFAQAVLHNMNERYHTGGGGNNFNKQHRYKGNKNNRGSETDRQWDGNNNRRSAMKRHGRNRRSEPSEGGEETAASRSERAAEIAAARARARQEWFEKSKALADGGGHIQSLNMGLDGHGAGDEAAQDEAVDGPFAWGNLQAAVDQLPEGHWAVPYLRGVANSLHQNASLSPTRKRLMMQQVTTSLASVSQADALSKASANMSN